MSTKPEQQKQKWITFKPGVRKQFFTAVIFMAIFMGIMLAGIILCGQAVGMSIGMATMGILMTLMNDYTMQPLKNTTMLVVSNVGAVMAAFLAYRFFAPGTPGYVTMVTVMTFISFFLAIMFLTSDKRSSAYMGPLISFSLLMFYPAYGWELFARCCIYAGAALLSMGINFLLHGKKFRKKIVQTLDGTIKNMETQVAAIKAGVETTEELMKRSVIIDKTLGGVEGAIGPKMSVLTNWQHGHDMIRTITILKRINNTITESYIKGGKDLTPDMYRLLEEMLESISKFEKDQISSEEISKQFDVLYTNLNTGMDQTEIVETLHSEMDDFIQGEVYHTDKPETKRSFGDWLSGHFSMHTFVFALKTALLACGGVFISVFFNFPIQYMFPLYVSITAQPFLEVTKGGVKKRILNTIYAVAIILISFSITDIVWVHLGIMIAIILIADMFLQFDFMTMMGTMISVVMNVIMQPDQLYVYPFWRLGYIAAACIAMQIVDMLIYPKTIPNTIQKQMKHSLEINKKIRNAFYHTNASYEEFHALIMEKRRANQKLKATNKFANSDALTAYLLADEGWLNHLSMVNHRLKEADRRIGDLRDFIETNSAPGVVVTMTHRQNNIIAGMYEVIADMAKAEQLAADMAKPAAA